MGPAGPVSNPAGTLLSKALSLGKDAKEAAGAGLGKKEGFEPDGESVGREGSGKEARGFRISDRNQEN